MKIGVFLFVRKMLVVLVMCSVVLLSGCAATAARKQTSKPLILEATYSPNPVRIDGILDDDVWRITSTYQFSLGQDQTAQGKKLAEPGDVRLAWDDTHFYVAIKFHDSDIVAEGKEDQLHHYGMGDLAELFLKPEGSTWYWELYATPTSKKSSFWFPGRGRLGLESGFQYQCGLQVAAENTGTVNHWEDRDCYWTAEMAMPIRDLTSRGETFRPGSNWRILVARYNYTRYLPEKELSMCPQLSQTRFHRHEEYGILKLVK